MKRLIQKFCIIPVFLLQALNADTTWEGTSSADMTLIGNWSSGLPYTPTVTNADFDSTYGGVNSNPEIPGSFNNDFPVLSFNFTNSGDFFNFAVTGPSTLTFTGDGITANSSINTNPLMTVSNNVSMTTPDSYYTDIYQIAFSSKTSDPSFSTSIGTADISITNGVDGTISNSGDAVNDIGQIVFDGSGGYSTSSTGYSTVTIEGNSTNTATLNVTNSGSVATSGNFLNDLAQIIFDGSGGYGSTATTGNSTVTISNYVSITATNESTGTIANNSDTGDAHGNDVAQILFDGSGGLSAAASGTGNSTVTIGSGSSTSTLMSASNSGMIYTLQLTNNIGQIVFDGGGGTDNSVGGTGNSTVNIGHSSVITATNTPTGSITTAGNDTAQILFDGSGGTTNSGPGSGSSKVTINGNASLTATNEASGLISCTSYGRNIGQIVFDGGVVDNGLSVSSVTIGSTSGDSASLNAINYGIISNTVNPVNDLAQVIFNGVHGTNTTLGSGSAVTFEGSCQLNVTNSGGSIHNEANTAAYNFGQVLFDGNGSNGAGNSSLTMSNTSSITVTNESSSLLYNDTGAIVNNLSQINFDGSGANGISGSAILTLSGSTAISAINDSTSSISNIGTANDLGQIVFDGSAVYSFPFTDSMGNATINISDTASISATNDGSISNTGTANGVAQIFFDGRLTGGPSGGPAVSAITCTGSTASIVATNGINGTISGGTVPGDQIAFYNTQISGNLIIQAINLNTTVGSVTNGIAFYETSTAPSANIQLSNTTLYLDPSVASPFTIGSLAGDVNSTVPLGDIDLIINTVGITTEFDGVISSTGGSLTKQGSGTLILTGPNSYSGGTSVLGGTLQGNTTSLQGDIYDTATVVFNQLTTGTFTSVISGDGGVVIKEGAGTLVLTAPNTYSGGTVVSDGILQGNTVSLQGAINNMSTVNFEQSITGTFLGSFTGDGTVNKNGAGRINYTVSSPNFTGTTYVNGGQLSLNSILGGNVIVQPGCLLSGSGTIGGNLNVFGTIAPGNSIGTMQVSGNFVEASGSTYQVQYNGAGQSTLIDVSGTAMLDSGSTVIATLINGIVDVNHKYLILSAEGGRSGQFSSVTSSNPLIIPTPIYEPQNVYLIFDAPILSASSTANQQNVAEQLFSISDPTSAELVLLTELSTLSPGQMQCALNQMSAQAYTNLLLTTALSSHQFINLLFEPLRTIVTSDICTRSQCCCQEFDVWMEGGSGVDHFSNSKTAKGFDRNNYEIAAGIQYGPNVDVTLGAAFSYEWDNIHYHLSTKGKRETVFGGIYGLWHPNEYYLLGDLMIGYGYEKVTRHMAIGNLDYTAHGRPKIILSALYFELGRDFGLCNFLIQPFVGLEMGHYHHNQINETGAIPINMSVNSKFHTNVVSSLGAHFTLKERSSFTFSSDISWQYRWGSMHNNSTENFVSFGTSFPITGLHVDPNSVEGALSISTQIYGGWEVFVEATGKWWPRAYSFNAIGGIKMSW